MKLVQVLTYKTKDGHESWMSVNPGQVTSVGTVTHGLSACKSFVRFAGGGTLETLHTYDDLHKLINAGLRG